MSVIAVIFAVYNTDTELTKRELQKVRRTDELFAPPQVKQTSISIGYEVIILCIRK